jgi:YARHG domain
MKTRKTIARFLAAAAVASGILMTWSLSSARAQDASSMSCGQLWYARNEIYARNGYCFQTARAQATFGKGCFPPYGALHGWEKDRVGELKMWEQRRGC